jgi:hypothetical protein
VTDDREDRSKRQEHERKIHFIISDYDLTPAAAATAAAAVSRRRGWLFSHISYDGFDISSSSPSSCFLLQEREIRIIVFIQGIQHTHKYNTSVHHISLSDG